MDTYAAGRMADPLPLSARKETRKQRDARRISELSSALNAVLLIHREAEGGGCRECFTSVWPCATAMSAVGMEYKK